MIPRAASLLLAAVLCAGLLALPGCGKDDGAGAAINYPIDAPPQRLDPAVARSPEELLVLGNCMEGLLRQDAQGRLGPGVAERWDTSPDGRVLTFHLRGDNHWRPVDKNALIEMADTQVTAEDFAFGLRRALNPAVNAPGAAGLFPILNAEKLRAGECPESALGVRVIDSLTLEITLERPGGAILHALARGAAMPCNRAYFEACGGRY
ncbi:MAG: ABC transporter substrate-binding protein, partial [Oscillospiraceae bacterium]|nr:ABC transporter substrate-binding protein [Oscillospiraceae bacterium]